MKDFFKSEYQKQQEKLNSEGVRSFSTDKEQIRSIVYKDETEEKTSSGIGLIVCGLILLIAGAFPFVGLIVGFLMALFIHYGFDDPTLSKKITDSSIGHFVGIMVISSAIILSIGSTLYYILFNIIWK